MPENDVRRKAEIVIRNELEARLMVLIGTFTADPSTDLITVSVNHGLVAGARVRFASSTTLPGGLSAGVTYFVIASGLTATVLRVSTTLGGPRVDITTGADTHTIYLTTWRVLVARGGTDNPDEEAEVQTPPFVVVQARTAEKMITGESTWLLDMAVGYVTELTDTLPKDHSAKLQELYVALEEIPAGFDPDENFRLHGIDILDTNVFSDTAKRARGDIISLRLGCSGEQIEEVP